jgi:hypothetical protein
MTKRQCTKKVAELFFTSGKVTGLSFTVKGETVTLAREDSPEMKAIEEKFTDKKDHPDWKPLMMGFYMKMAQIALNELYMTKNIMYHDISDIKVG